MTRLIFRLIIAPVTALGLWAATAATQASLVEEVERALSLKERPFGIVFEVATRDSDGLETVLPAITEAVRHIRRVAPQMHIAIVTHGKEQFALTRENAATHNKTHKQVQNLVTNAGVDVHVCGTYAEWHNKAPEDFPDYVEVSAAGPAQINDYRTLGYVVIQAGPGDQAATTSPAGVKHAVPGADSD